MMLGITPPFVAKNVSSTKIAVATGPLFLQFCMPYCGIPIWQEAMQEAGADVVDPLINNILQEHRPLLIKSFVAAEIHDEGKYHASDVDATRAKAGFAGCFPCGDDGKECVKRGVGGFGVGQSLRANEGGLESLHLFLGQGHVAMSEPRGAVGACMVLDRQGGGLAKGSGSAEVLP